MALQLDLVALVGDDESFPFVAIYNEQRSDLTDCTVTAYVKASRSASDDDATTYTNDAGIEITDEGRGEFTWTFPHSDNIVTGTLWYRIKITDADSNVTTYFMGNLTVLAV